jgi:hypothetical protein
MIHLLRVSELYPLGFLSLPLCSHRARLRVLPWSLLTHALNPLYLSPVALTSTFRLWHACIGTYGQPLADPVFP